MTAVFIASMVWLAILAIIVKVIYKNSDVPMEALEESGALFIAGVILILGIYAGYICLYP